MKITAKLTVCSLLAALSCAHSGLAAPPSTTMPSTQSNGLRWNDLRWNGISVQGMKLNGFRMNGPILQGMKLNGFRINGPVLQGMKINGLVLQDVLIDGLYPRGVLQPGRDDTARSCTPELSPGEARVVIHSTGETQARFALADVRVSLPEPVR